MLVLLLYTFFGTQTLPDGVTICTLRNAEKNPVNCELSAVASFLVAAESQTMAFGVLEVIVNFFLILVMFVVALWPFISSFCRRIFPLSLIDFFEKMNWTRFGTPKKEEEVVVGDLFLSVY